MTAPTMQSMRGCKQPDGHGRCHDPHQIGRPDCADCSFAADELPETWGSLENLTLLDGGNNRVVGALPDSWGILHRLPRLTQLDLSENRLAGKEAMCTMTCYAKSNSFLL